MRYSQIVEGRLPRGFRIYRMPKGTHVFHGTGATFSADALESPCWVSTSIEVARHFIDWHSHHRDPDEDADHQEHEQGDRIIEYVTMRPLRLLYVEGRHTFTQIENRYGWDMHDVEEMAENVCRLGYDGWYIEANYVEGDDVMICDSSVLQYTRTIKVR